MSEREKIIEVMAEENARLREALSIFVDRPWMKCLSDDLSPNHLISMDACVGDLRRARAALKETGQ